MCPLSMSDSIELSSTIIESRVFETLCMEVNQVYQPERFEAVRQVDGVCTSFTEIHVNIEIASTNDVTWVSD